MKRRSTYEIGQNILVVCRKGSNKTKIVYRANLNSCRVNKHLEMLIKIGFLTKVPQDNGNFVYKTTPDGLRAMEKYFSSKNES